MFFTLVNSIKVKTGARNIEWYGIFVEIYYYGKKVSTPASFPSEDSLETRDSLFLLEVLNQKFRNVSKINTNNSHLLVSSSVYHNTSPLTAIFRRSITLRLSWTNWERSTKSNWATRYSRSKTKGSTNWNFGSYIAIRCAPYWPKCKSVFSETFYGYISDS